MMIFFCLFFLASWFLNSALVLFLFVIFVFFLFNTMGLTCLGYFWVLDGYSLAMFLLVVLLYLMLSLCKSFDLIMFTGSLSIFMSFLFLLLFLLFIFFSCCSIFLFFLVFEFSIIPVFILIFNYGYGVNRFQASMYMFIYTLFSSLPFLFVILYFFLEIFPLGFNLVFFVGLEQKLIGGWFFFLVLVFLVKLPFFVFHLWLPKAHVEAPLLGSMLLAGVLLKLGGYGLYKFSVYFFYVSFFFSYWFGSFSLLSGVLLCVVCLRQVDLKAMVAYSSVVHMALVVSTLFMMGGWGIVGGYLMMISHGLCSPILFFFANLFYIVYGSRSMVVIKGLIFFNIVIVMFYFFFCMFNMGMPPSFNFFSEVFLFLGLSVSSVTYALFFSCFFLFNGFYNVLMYCMVAHGSLKYCLGVEAILSLKGVLLFFFCLFYLVFFMFFAGFIMLCQCILPMKFSLWN